jgi:predicted outer membrane protein
MNMIKTLAHTAAAALLLGGVAFAQNAPEITWDEQTRDTFFSGSSARSADEIRMGWSTLSATQQESVRAYCLQMQADAGAASPPGTALDPDAATGSDADTTASTAVDPSTGGRVDGGTGKSADRTGYDVTVVQEACSAIRGL